MPTLENHCTTSEGTTGSSPSGEDSMRSLPRFLGVAAAHEFEIAMALVNPAMISHWSALHHHGLTEQVPRDVFVLTTTGTWIPRSREGRQRQSKGSYAVGDTTYRFIQVTSNRFFGDERVWVGDARVSVTDLERTLLDGLSMPQHCGDFAEVIHAFRVGMDRLNTERITEYAIRLGVTTAKRLGWVLGIPGRPPVQARRVGLAAHQGLPKTGLHGASKGAMQQPLDGPGEPAREVGT